MKNKNNNYSFRLSVLRRDKEGNWIVKRNPYLDRQDILDNALSVFLRDQELLKKKHAHMNPNTIDPRVRNQAARWGGNLDKYLMNELQDSELEHFLLKDNDYFKTIYIVNEVRKNEEEQLRVTNRERERHQHNKKVARARTISRYTYVEKRKIENPCGPDEELTIYHRKPSFFTQLFRRIS